MKKEIGDKWFEKIKADIDKVLESEKTFLEKEFSDLEKLQSENPEIPHDEYDLLHQAKIRCKNSIVMALNTDDANTTHERNSNNG